MSKKTSSLFAFFEEATKRPVPFERYTATDLWTNEHTSAQMLQYHLNPDVDLSSRKHAFIEASVRWMQDYFDIGNGFRIADFGCGPGLYTNRLAQLGAFVTGIDFSARSIEYALEASKKQGLLVNYVTQDYLQFQSDERFDLILMIFCDYCALSPQQRRALLGIFRKHLKPGGRVLLDVHSLAAFADFQGSVSLEKNQLNGFWAAEDYYGIRSSLKYEEKKVRLDKYTIVTSTEVRTIYNWLQYFDLEQLKSEFLDSGFRVDKACATVGGSAYSPEAPEIAVVARADGDF